MAKDERESETILIADKRVTIEHISNLLSMEKSELQKVKISLLKRVILSTHWISQRQIILMNS